MKVAIVHYWFITRRGGEKVVESILKLFPQADIYTLFYDKDSYGDFIEKHNIYTSSLNNKLFQKYYQKIFPLYPLGIQSLKLKEDYDLVISSESGPAKGIKIENKKTKHICYIHSPMRYCWGFTNEYINSITPILRPFAKFFFFRLKKWDKTTINNVDYYIANSKNVANRVKKFYNKKAQVIYPPIEPKLFTNKLKNVEKTHFLSFGAITPYKKIDLLVDCFNKNGLKLIIIGNGSEKGKLQQKANENISFKGFLEDHELKKYIEKSKALLFPGEEDFGMIPLEVMSYGVPTIAYKKGGAIETVIENKDSIKESSGIFFKKQSVNSLQKAINFFLEVESGFNSEWIRNHAISFEEKKFLSSFDRFVKKKLK